LYTFKKTEINNKKASDFETKSLLYLIGIRGDKDEVEVITIDCFNDVTGANNSFSKLWDIQSKNHKNLPPSKIGESLITLYDNYISDFSFSSYILFIPKLKDEYLVDSSLSTYGYENINDKQKKGIEKKLIEKITGVGGFKKPPLLGDFLCNVTFVEDNKKVSAYIKKIARFKNKKLISEELYESIFNEIRDVQTALKNTYIENEVINEPIEVLKYNRHITKKEINTLLISRLVGVEVFSFSGVPLPFLPVIKGLDTESVEDLIQECNANLSRAFFDKNGCLNFWRVSEFIIQHARDNPDSSLEYIHKALLSSVKISTNYLTENTILYMISLVITGIKNEN